MRHKFRAEQIRKCENQGCVPFVISFIGNERGGLDVLANYTEDEQVAKSPAKVPVLAPNYKLAATN